MKPIGQLEKKFFAITEMVLFDSLFSLISDFAQQRTKARSREYTNSVNFMTLGQSVETLSYLQELYIKIVIKFSESDRSIDPLTKTNTIIYTLYKVEVIATTRIKIKNPSIISNIQYILVYTHI